MPSLEFTCLHNYCLIQLDSTDTVELHFQKADGTIVQLFLDFQKEVQIYRLMILSEEEWEPHQVFFYHDDYFLSDNSFKNSLSMQFKILYLPAFSCKVTSTFVLFLYSSLQQQFNPASIGGPHHHQSSSSSSSSSHFQFGHHQQYQTVCFVMKLAKQDFIAADAIAKLRQV